MAAHRTADVSEGFKRERSTPTAATWREPRSARHRMADSSTHMHGYALGCAFRRRGYSNGLQKRGERPARRWGRGGRLERRARALSHLHLRHGLLGAVGECLLHQLTSLPSLRCLLASSQVRTTLDPVHTTVAAGPHRPLSPDRREDRGGVSPHQDYGQPLIDALHPARARCLATVRPPAPSLQPPLYFRSPRVEPLVPPPVSPLSSK